MRSKAFWCGVSLIVLGLAGSLVWKVPGIQAVGAPVARLDPQTQQAPAADFDRDVAPIFKASCAACHSGDESKGHLRLDSEAAVLKGGVSGKAVVPGDSGHSLLVKRVMGLGDAPRMPLGGDPLSSAKLDLIRRWIDHLTPQEASDVLRAASRQTSQTPQPAAQMSSTVASPAPASAPSGSDVYTAKIKPLLQERCIRCHGPDVQQNDLRLDSLANALKGSASGKVIVPGDSEKSPIVRRLLGLDKPQMPYGGPPLSAAQVTLIRHWIDQGAPGPRNEAVASHAPVTHWAYIKPVRPALPKVKNAAWCRNPIDYFVLARLEKEGLPPSPEADKETLIRRVYLDLIGLPPTPQQVDAFVADQSPNAYEKVVDQLLASPHYGERWARPWLDLSRYADSNGYEKDNLRVAWKYRDWVINALNQDMSFKEFTIEQIAGDMLPHPTVDQLIATGFHRNTMLNQEGGVDKEEQRFYTLVDRVNTTADVWLGTTLACAQCHNHKFDPFTQKDYYRMLAFFDSNSDYKILDLGQGEGYVSEPQIELPTQEQAVKANAYRSEIKQFQKTLETETPQLEAAQAKWEEEVKAAEKAWSDLTPSRYRSEGGATLTLLPDHSILASGKNPYADTYDLEATTSLKGITALRIGVLNDASLPHGGPGRDADGNFFLSDFEVEAAPADKSAPPQKIVFREAADSESQPGYGARNLVHKDPANLTGWAIDASPSSVPLVRQAVLIPDKPFGFDRGTVLTIHMKHNMRHATRNIGRFRLSVTTTADPKLIVQVPARLRPVLDMPAGKRSEQQQEKLAALYRSIAPLLQPTRDQIAKLEKSLEDLHIVTALIMGEEPGYERAYTYIRIRGSFSSKGEKVYAGVPSALNPLPADQMPNRLGLANWLVSDDNPLTARVTVNRYWEAIFGRGIVDTPEDFGTQGDAPTHPQLLDWLATEFMRDGWSMKQIKRLMVTSATYRQSSKVTPELEERDPYNKLLAHGPRFRVEAEMVRDIALAASGLLSPKIGGPSVFPYQPDGVWDRPYSDAKWIESSAEDRYRRGIYVFVRRTAPYPSLVTFDAPSREFCTVRRVRTNTPLQALTTLNDPVYFEAAQALGKLIMANGGPDPESRATYGFRRVLSRHPTESELRRIIAYYNQELDRYRQDPKAAVEVIGGSTAKIASAAPSVGGSSDAELAAWTMVSNVLLNLDETITKQ